VMGSRLFGMCDRGNKLGFRAEFCVSGATS
jgi:hypothetical protein